MGTRYSTIWYVVRYECCEWPLLIDLLLELGGKPKSAGNMQISIELSWIQCIQSPLVPNLGFRNSSFATM